MKSCTPVARGPFGIGAPSEPVGVEPSDTGGVVARRAMASAVVIEAVVGVRLAAAAAPSDMGGVMPRRASASPLAIIAPVFGVVLAGVLGAAAAAAAAAAPSDTGRRGQPIQRLRGARDEGLSERGAHMQWLGHCRQRSELRAYRQRGWMHPNTTDKHHVSSYGQVHVPISAHCTAAALGPGQLTRTATSTCVFVTSTLSSSESLMHPSMGHHHSHALPGKNRRPAHTTGRPQECKRTSSDAHALLLRYM